MIEHSKCVKCEHRLGKITTEDETSKVCVKCGERKELSDYYRKKDGKYGRRTTCIECERVPKYLMPYKGDRRQQKCPICENRIEN